ncbi:MAG: DMT family transporter [Pseudomonadota bacterium]|nr:DMT family transporter [Pseudomonadota bacterium]
MPQLFQAVLWFCGTMIGFAGMAISARELFTTMSTFEILFFRSLIGVIVILPFILKNRLRDLRTGKFRYHGFRALVQYSAQICWMHGILYLTLSDLTAIEFTVPVFTAILAVIFLGETMWRHKWIATIIGFAGVLIILQPEGSAFSLAGFVMLFGSFLYSASGIIVKYLTRTDSPQGIIFYMNLIQLPLGLIPAIFLYQWVNPSLTDVPWIIVWGLSGLMAHYTMARALQLADITIIFPLDFIRLPLMALLGFLIYSEAISPSTALGAIVIFAANWHCVRAEASRDRKPETH